MSVSSIPYCGDCLGLNLHPCAHVRCKVSIIIVIFVGTSPWPAWAGGPRMDRRAVTSLGVVNISRLASSLRGDLIFPSDPKT